MAKINSLADSFSCSFSDFRYLKGFVVIVEALYGVKNRLVGLSCSTFNGDIGIYEGDVEYLYVLKLRPDGFSFNVPALVV